MAALLAVAGGAAIEFPDQPSAVNAAGILLVQLSNAAFAFGQISYKRLMASREALRDKNVFGLLYGGAVFVAGLFCWATTGFHRLSVRPDQALALLYLGLVASGLCFFLWNLGARKVNPGMLAVMNNLKIPVGVAASLVILKEPAGYVRLILGCSLFAAALWVNERRRSAVSGR
jgi:drug/metabolite transporter (DMT)-like permease